MNKTKLREYGGRILEDGTLEMRDPNDNARRRHQYRLVDGVPSKRCLPANSDTWAGETEPPAWEPVDVEVLRFSAGVYHPLLDYFGIEPRLWGEP
jgi:hypothetical protein